MLKWLSAIYTLIISLIIAGVILTITGVINPQATIINYAGTMPAFAPYFETYSIGAHWQNWRQQQDVEIELARQELEEIHLELVAKEKQLEELSNSLARQEQALSDEVLKNKSVANLAHLYTEMRPEEAVAILQLMEEDLVLDVILAMDSESAALILASLPPEMAAQLSTRFQ